MFRSITVATTGNGHSHGAGQVDLLGRHPAGNQQCNGFWCRVALDMYGKSCETRPLNCSPGPNCNLGYLS